VTAASQNYTAGQGTSSPAIPVTVAAQGNFTGNVSLTAISYQSGLTASFDVNSWPGISPTFTATSHLTISVDPALEPGEYSVFIQGTGPSGSYPASQTVWIDVTNNVPPDFSIGAITSESIQAGQSLNFSGEIVPVPFSGFSGTVTLTGLAPGDAPGISLPNSVSISSGPQSFIGTVTSTANTVSCTYTLPVSGVSGNIQHSSSINVSVQGGASPSATPSWRGVTVTSAAATSFLVTATATSCFSGAASFAVSGFPSGIHFTFPSPSPTITGPASPANPAIAGGIGVSVDTGVATQAYTGTLTVTLGGVAYSSALVVTVAPPVVTPPPSYSLSCTNCGNGLLVTPGGAGALALIAITRQNGFAYNPVLSTGIVPPGISVSFDNSATESPATSDVVALTVTASAAASTGSSFYLPVAGWDGVSPFSVGLSSPFVVTVNGSPLSISSSVRYSIVNAQTHIPNVTTLTATAMGGVPPYTYTLSRDISWGPVQSAAPLQYSMAQVTSDRHALLTVTDSSPSPQTVAKNVLIPVPQAYPDSMLHSAVLGRVSAVESLAASLQAQGADPSGVWNAIQSQLGITPTQYGNLVPVAAQLQAAHAGIKTPAVSAVNSLHQAGYTVPSVYGGAKRH